MLSENRLKTIDKLIEFAKSKNYLLFLSDKIPVRYHLYKIEDKKPNLVGVFSDMETVKTIIGDG